VDFIVCTLAVKKKIRAGFDMSDRTIPLLAYLIILFSTCGSKQLFSLFSKKSQTSSVGNYRALDIFNNFSDVF
jgi:hypothetical protein